MVDLGGEEGPGDKGGSQEDLLEGAKETVIDHVLSPAGECIPLIEVEIDPRDVFPDNFDFSGVSASQSSLVGKADEGDLEGVKPHHLGSNGVNGDHIPAGKEEVLHVRLKGSGTCTTPCNGPIGDTEKTRMDLLLDLQEVHQSFVDDPVGPVTVLIEEPTKGVLHRSGDSSKNMGL